jgi:hypothetical protein
MGNNLTRCRRVSLHEFIPIPEKPFTRLRPFQQNLVTGFGKIMTVIPPAHLIRLLSHA